MKVQHWGFAGGLVALCCTCVASAQGVLERIGAGGKLVIARRESSVPFSCIDFASGKPVGYAVDLSGRAVGGPDPKALPISPFLRALGR